jgi:hypothetical protein
MKRFLQKVRESLVISDCQDLKKHGNFFRVARKGRSRRSSKSEEKKFKMKRPNGCPDLGLQRRPPVNLGTLLSPLCTIHSPLCTLRSTLCTLHPIHILIPRPPDAGRKPVRDLTLLPLALLYAID